jgi:hypothetical protein
MLRLFKLLKLLRLLRVAKLLKQLKKIEDGIVAALSLHSHSVFSLFKLLVMLLTFAHWNGCIQFYVSETVDTIAMNGTRTELHESSWIVRGQLQNLEPFEQWSWSYYHAMVRWWPRARGVAPPRDALQLSSSPWHTCTRVRDGTRCPNPQCAPLDAWAAPVTGARRSSS